MRIYATPDVEFTSESPIKNKMYATGILVGKKYPEAIAFGFVGRIESKKAEIKNVTITQQIFTIAKIYFEDGDNKVSKYLTSDSDGKAKSISEQDYLKLLGKWNNKEALPFVNDDGVTKTIGKKLDKGTPWSASRDGQVLFYWDAPGWGYGGWQGVKAEKPVEYVELRFRVKVTAKIGNTDPVVKEGSVYLKAERIGKMWFTFPDDEKYFKSDIEIKK